MASLSKLDNIKTSSDYDIPVFLNFIKVLLKNCKIKFFKKEQIMLMDFFELFLLPNFFYKKDFLLPNFNINLFNKKLVFSENFLNKVQAINPAFKLFYNRDFDTNVDSLQNFYFYFYKKNRGTLPLDKKNKSSNYLKILFHFNKF